jgi:DNA-binding response OmpR family regulator
MAKKILLVDDEKDTATVFETALRQGGYEVTVANNGTSALSNAKTGAFDLILMDQMMPDISGIDALSTLKSDHATSQVPVAMLTNFSHDEMVKEALNRGAVDYILKYQISPQDLIAKVKALLGE